MINKKISTIAGSIIIVAIVVALGFVFLSDKENEVKNQNNVVLNNSELGNKEEVKQGEEKIESNRQENNDKPSSFTKNIYTNPKYNFQITVSDGWKIMENDSNSSEPVFTFYKEIAGINSNETTSPSIFNEGTFVIVRPHGQGTSNLPGETLPSKIISSENIKVASDYILKNKSKWATFINFKNNPKSWEESGFVFGRNIIQNERKTCKRNNAIIDENICDLWNGDVITHDGYINELDRKQIEELLSSFKFIL